MGGHSRKLPFLYRRPQGVFCAFIWGLASYSGSVGGACMNNYSFVVDPLYPMLAMC